MLADVFTGAGLGLALGLIASWLAVWLPKRLNELESQWVDEVLAERREEALKSASQMSHLPGFLGGVSPKWVLSILCLSLGALAAMKFGISPAALLVVGLICGLVTLAFIDAKTMLLPDDLTLSLLWIGLLIQVHPLTQTVGPQQAIVGAAAGYGILWAIAQIFLRIRKKEGLGYGDMKLLGALGAWLGVQSLPMLLLASALMALVWQLVAVIRKQSELASAFPFGPWIAIAGVGYVFWFL